MKPASGSLVSLRVGATLLAPLTARGRGEAPLAGADSASVLALRGTQADNLLGLKANDQVAFSRDFNDQTRGVMAAAAFVDLKKNLDDGVGGCVSRRVQAVAQTDGFFVAAYTAKFEKEE